jgi:hypothetical protein
VDPELSPLSVIQSIGLLYCSIHEYGIMIKATQKPGFSHISKAHPNCALDYPKYQDSLLVLLKTSERSVYIPGDTCYNPVDLRRVHEVIDGLKIMKGIYCKVCCSYQVAEKNHRLMTAHFEKSHPTIVLASSNIEKCFIQQLYAFKSSYNPYFRVNYIPLPKFSSLDCIEFKNRINYGAYVSIPIPNEDERFATESERMTDSLFIRLDWSSMVSTLNLELLLAPVGNITLIRNLMKEYIQFAQVFYKKTPIDYKLIFKSRSMEMTLPSCPTTIKRYQSALEEFCFFIINLYSLTDSKDTAYLAIKDLSLTTAVGKFVSSPTLNAWIDILESLICVEFKFSDSDWKSHFFTFIIIKTANLDKKVVEINDFTKSITHMKFLIKTFFIFRLHQV